MSPRRRGLELYEVLQRQETVRRTGTCDVAASEPPSVSASGPPPDPAVGPQGVVGDEETVDADQALHQVFRSSAGQLSVTLRSHAWAVVALGLIFTHAAAYWWGERGWEAQTTTPTSAADSKFQQVRTQASVPFAAVSVSTKKPKPSSTRRPASVSSTAASTADRRIPPSARAPLPTNRYRLLIASYPVQSEKDLLLASRAVKTFRDNGFDEIEVKRVSGTNGVYQVLWGKAFDSATSKEATDYKRRIQQEGRRLNKEHRLEQVQEFQDCYFKKVAVASE